MRQHGGAAAQLGPRAFQASCQPSRRTISHISPALARLRSGGGAWRGACTRKIPGAPRGESRGFLRRLCVFQAAIGGSGALRAPRAAVGADPAAALLRRSATAADVAVCHLPSPLTFCSLHDAVFRSGHHSVVSVRRSARRSRQPGSLGERQQRLCERAPRQPWRLHQPWRCC